MLPPEVPSRTLYPKDFPERFVSRESVAAGKRRGCVTFLTPLQTASLSNQADKSDWKWLAIHAHPVTTTKCRTTNYTNEAYERV
jgi:hypothetical protein